MGVAIDDQPWTEETDNEYSQKDSLYSDFINPLFQFLIHERKPSSRGRQVGGL